MDSFWNQLVQSMAIILKYSIKHFSCLLVYYEYNLNTLYLENLEVSLVNRVSLLIYPNGLSY